MPIEIRSAVDVPLRALAAALTSAFDGYVGGTRAFDAAGLADLVHRDGIHLGHSLAAFLGGSDDPAGVALIAWRDGRSRIAGMGVAKEAQGRGVGRALLEGALAQARARGDRGVELECIHQNERALCLYQSAGFETRRLLAGFEAPRLESRADGELRAVRLSEAARAIAADGSHDLPWQLTAPTLLGLGADARAHRLDRAWVVWRELPSERILYAMLTEPAARRRGEGRALLRALAHMHPDLPWRVPAICPDEHATFLETCGFRRGELFQHHMFLELT